MQKLYTSTPITNHYKSNNNEAVKAMTAHRSTKLKPITEATKDYFQQKDNAIDAMDTPSTASVINRKKERLS